MSIITGDGTTINIQRGADIRVNPSVTVTPDRAWDVLPLVYAEFGIKPDVQDPARHTLGVTAHRFSTRILNRNASDFFECGLDPGLQRPLADQAPVTARVLTEIHAIAAGAELRTVVEGTARRTGGNAGTAACRSTGLMEVLIGQMVQKKAAPADTVRIPKALP
ncbi:MAG: hypothetical protein FIA95_04740 [Gemmatimonadetes bacterium]|nr:hypothetical protein [Gemmatimonadota bacterium]